MKSDLSDEMCVNIDFIVLKLLFLEMMSTPTNKLATYFGDDKPTSRSKVKWKLSLLSIE